MRLFLRYIIIMTCFIGFLFASVQANDYWGAIAMDVSNGITGTASNFNTEAAGKDGALKTCSKKGGHNCKIIAFWANGCSAAAWSPKNKSARSVLTETSIELAKKNAIQRCVMLEKDPNCKVVSSVCTNWDVVETIWW